MTGSADILTESERARIGQAIGRAEAGTAGEIVVLVAARAGLYRSPALALALAIALALPWPLILLTHLSASEIALAQAGGVLAALAATLNERVRIALTPRPWRHERARAAARHEFVAHGLTATRGRTGVLIYVALAERYAEIVADTGVEARVPAERWQTTLTGLLAAAGNGALADGLVTAVEDVGGLLAVKLPGDGAGDEIPNRVIVLD